MHISGYIKSHFPPSTYLHQKNILNSSEYNTNKAMNLTIKAFFLVFLLLFCSLSTGKVGAYGIRVKPIFTSHKGEMRANSRKLFVLDAVLDYGEAGANTKHDQKGKKGGGGKNP
ncbi:Hypothetical predicted protein [Olea europaea subsp. europaea]|uniref:Transmembrane protein n=2 Tax=Olea europaea subsp. europaea TaxID=158383 RepID=A0A8S0TD48_OLEEU|nr:Hypothetical predicted protein [Olea europaea subsp. europaea]